MNTILVNMSSYIGIDPLILKILLGVCFTVVLALSVYKWTGSIALFSITVITCILIFGLVLGWIPVWTVFLFIVLILMRVAQYIYGDKPEILEQYSDSYGKSLSLAYEAKFGYKNPEFDKEVSQHILAVESLKKGITRQIHLEKLHRIEKFVELKK